MSKNTFWPLTDSKKNPEFSETESQYLKSNTSLILAPLLVFLQIYVWDFFTPNHFTIELATSYENETKIIKFVYFFATTSIFVNKLFNRFFYFKCMLFSTFAVKRKTYLPLMISQCNSFNNSDIIQLDWRPQVLVPFPMLIYLFQWKVIFQYVSWQRKISLVRTYQFYPLMFVDHYHH